MQARSAVCTLYFVVQLHPKRQCVRPMFYRLMTLVFHGYVKTSAFISKLLFTFIHARKDSKTERMATVLLFEFTDNVKQQNGNTEMTY